MTTTLGRLARLVRVAAVPLLAGCAGHGVTLGALSPAGPAGTPGEIGVIQVRPGRAGVVVAAPHASSDPRTGDVAAALADRTGFGLVIATGFALEPDAPGRAGRRFQVNRPSEGRPGGGSHEEVRTPAADEVYRLWELRVAEAARGPLELYVEIHGNNRRETAGRIEVATVGIDREVAERLRAHLELARDARLRAAPGAPRLEFAVEPADPVVYAASGAKRDGILRVPRRALHIELPRVARLEAAAVYVPALAAVLAESLPLLVGP